MRDIITVMKFTMKDMVKRKSFIISTLIILILIVIGFNIPNIIKNITGGEQESKLLIVDDENIFEGNLEVIQQADLGYDIELGKATFDEIKAKIEKSEIDAAIIVEKQENDIKIRYIVEDTTMMNGVPEDLIKSINTLYTNIQINKLGLTEAELESITPNFVFNLEQTAEEKAQKQSPALYPWVPQVWHMHSKPSILVCIIFAIANNLNRSEFPNSCFCHRATPSCGAAPRKRPARARAAPQSGNWYRRRENTRRCSRG